MEDETNNLPANSVQYCCTARIISPEIVEIGDDNNNNNNISICRDVSSCSTDVYVAVGKDDLDVLKWALDHSVSPGARVFLVHVFPPLTFIPTPVGKLSRSQLSQEQVRVYVNEQNDRRRNRLQKYVRLCADAKVTVDTMLIESNETAKAILDLIPVLNITKLIVGAKRPPATWRPIKKMAKGEYVKKNAPDYCEVTIVHNGKKVVEGGEGVTEPDNSSLASRAPGKQVIRNSEKKFFECVCFSGNFN